MLKLLLFILTWLHGICQCNASVIDCTAQQCNGQIIRCIEGEDCIIECNGGLICADKTIICPESEKATCSVACNGDESCARITIYALQSLSLNITSDGYEALSSSRIYCPKYMAIGSCAVTHFGNNNGFNMMVIYTIHDYSAIDIECKSSTSCWANDNNPTLHFGDSYSKSCTMYDIDGNRCTSGVISTEIPQKYQQDETLNLFSNELFKLFTIGLSAGLLVGLCCCFGYFCGERISKKLTTINISNNFHNNKTCKTNLTPSSLNKISPELQARMSADIDFDIVGDLRLDLNVIEEKGAHAVNVTVQKYANPNNRKDESAINSPLSINDSIIQNIHATVADINTNVVTGGIAADEFIVSPISSP